jgi:hypothetical protein
MQQDGTFTKDTNTFDRSEFSEKSRGKMRDPTILNPGGQ